MARLIVEAVSSEYMSVNVIWEFMLFVLEVIGNWFNEWLVFVSPIIEWFVTKFGVYFPEDIAKIIGYISGYAFAGSVTIVVIPAAISLMSMIFQPDEALEGLKGLGACIIGPVILAVLAPVLVLALYFIIQGNVLGSIVAIVSFLGSVLGIIAFFGNLKD